MPLGSIVLIRSRPAADGLAEGQSGGGHMQSVINGGAPEPGRRRVRSIGVRSVSARLAAREARLKALVHELLRQAQLAENRGNERFKDQRLTEAECVLRQLGPSSGQSQQRAQLDRLRGRPVPQPPQKTRRRGPVKLCLDCGARDAVVILKYCDGCDSPWMDLLSIVWRELQAWEIDCADAALSQVLNE